MRLPKVLYHGTSAVHLPAVLESGLLPGAVSGISNYADMGRPPSEFVYLSAGLAIQYALAIAAEHGDLVIVEVNVERLDESLLRPDEDYYFDHLLPFGQALPSGDRARDTRMVLGRMREEAQRTMESLYVTGNVAYLGRIPTTAISRVSHYQSGMERDLFLQLYIELLGELSGSRYLEHAKRFVYFMHQIMGQKQSVQALLAPATVSLTPSRELQRMQDELDAMAPIIYSARSTF